MYKELELYVRNLRKNNPSIKIVATNGCFDILHIGHLKMLKHAKSLGDILIVGLNSDESVKSLKGPSRPINNQENRKKLLEELRCVDFVQIFYTATCEEFLSISKPNIYFKSGDYSIESLNKKEKAALDKSNTKILFGDLVPNISTTKISSLL